MAARLLFTRNTTSIRHFGLTTSTMARRFSSFLISPAELTQRLTSNPSSGSPRIIPICGSWFLPNDSHKRTGSQVFREGHIPGARFFDLDQVSDTSSPYPHMLPSPEVFQAAMSELGVERGDTLVVYDSKELGIFSGPRVAWTLKVFGHPSVHLLNNYKLYVEQGFPVESGEQKDVSRTSYPLSQLDKSRVVDFEEVAAIAKAYNETGKPQVQILDARSEGRWKGADPEPRPGLSSGHIPGSTSLAMSELLDPVTKAFLPAEELKRLLQCKGVDGSKPVISSCGTGVTATVIDTAIMEAGLGDGERRIYDGSWTEWAQRVEAGDGLIVKSV